MGLTTRFSMNCNKAFKNYGAPLKLLKSQASNIAVIVYMHGVERSLDLINGFIYKSSNIFKWKSYVFDISEKSP